MTLLGLELGICKTFWKKHFIEAKTYKLKKKSEGSKVRIVEEVGRGEVTVQTKEQ